MTFLFSVTLQVGLGREKKTSVNIFYREFTGGAPRDNSHRSQLDRLQRQINHWRDLANNNRDYVLLGDTNLWSMTWLDENYDNNRKELAEIF